MKTTIAENTPNMTDDMLNSKKVLIPQLSMAKGKDLLIKYLYYFAISKNYMVTNLRKIQSITAFEAYLNWFLKDEMKDNTSYSLSPVIIKQKIEKLKKVKGIKFQAPKYKKNKNKEPQPNNVILKRFNNVKKNFLHSGLFKEIKNLNDIINNDAVTIDILLKFATHSDNNDMQGQISAILKNIVDTETVTLNTKDGQVKLGDVEYIKTLEVETTESGLLSEPELYTGMVDFLNLLNKEQ